jgi:acetolactate synthase-1/2/3 large subunit
MTIMTGGEAAVQALISQGVDTLFGLPGIQNDWLYNALYDIGGDIRVIHPRHEQGAAYMALGYALASGRPSVFSVVPGPGILNASAALATAYGLNAPVLCLSGQIRQRNIGSGVGALHELPDQLGILERLTKWTARVRHPAETPGTIAEAFRQMLSGRPRPTAVEIPMDVLALKAEVDNQPPETVLFAPPIDSAMLEEAAQVLGKAKNPMIYVGSGAQGVGPEITALAEMLQAPVVAYRTGHGVLDGRNPLSLFMQESHAYWKKTDAVLIVGTNLRLPPVWGIDDQMTTIRIDVDPVDHHLTFRPDIAINARAEDALPELVRRTAAHNPARGSRAREMAEIRAWWNEKTAYLEPQLSYLKAIRAELPEDGIMLDELTQMGYAARIAFPSYHPRSFISTGYMGTLGYGFPTGLGVKVARPDRPVLSLTGDGGFMFTVQELATAVQHQIASVTIVFNNGSYGNVQQMQKRVHGGRVIATDLRNPDFVALAESFGAQGLRASSPEALREALRQGFAYTEGPTVIEVPHGEIPSVDDLRSMPRIRG